MISVLSSGWHYWSVRHPGERKLTSKEPGAGLPGHKHIRPHPLAGLNGIQGQDPRESF